MLTMGLIATRTGYLKVSRRSGKPLDLAVTTYCLRNSSSRHPRITVSARRSRPYR